MSEQEGPLDMGKVLRDIENETWVEPEGENKLANTNKSGLVANLMDLVEELEAAQQAVVTLSMEAKEYQAELASRGTHMQFDALDGVLTIGREITPSPGMTEAIPEDFSQVSEISIKEPIDTRSVAAIQKDSKGTAEEIANDSQNLEEFSGREMKKAINSMMGIRY